MFEELFLSSFQHVSFSGAKSGGCHEVQKYRVYRNRLFLTFNYQCNLLHQFIFFFMFFFLSRNEGIALNTWDIWSFKKLYCIDMYLLLHPVIWLYRHHKKSVTYLMQITFSSRYKTSWDIESLGIKY